MKFSTRCRRKLKRKSAANALWYNIRHMKLHDYIGETSAYDKKLMLERDNPISWLKSVSAFANTLGGKLLFGVSNEGVLVGLVDAEKDAEDISEVIKMQMDPIPQTKLSIHRELGKKFVIVEVFSGDETPYYVRHKGSLTAYVRIGNESVRADSIQLKRLVLKGDWQSWDSMSSKFKRTDYAFDVLREEYHNKTELSFAEKDLASFDLVDSKGRLTNAGALMADSCPLRQSRVFCTRWNGLDKANGVMEAQDDDEYEGSLISLLRKTKGFIQVNSKTKWRKSPTGRQNFPEYPSEAVDECIVNALIHRDYLEIGSEVHVDMFDDRMEIYSPGGMPSGKFIQKLVPRKVNSMRRNPVIADLFHRLDLMERRGSGFGKILDAYKIASTRLGREFVPSFHSDATDFIVTLPNLQYGMRDVQTATDAVPAGVKSATSTTQKSTQKSTQKTTQKTTRKIISAITNNSNVTRRELAEMIGITPDGAKKALESLKRNGLIRRIGPDKGGYWEVVSD